jgi:hypothetical protein
MKTRLWRSIQNLRTLKNRAGSVCSIVQAGHLGAEYPNSRAVREARATAVELRTLSMILTRNRNR